MSFILDALRKSENERQRRSGPGITDVITAPGSRGRPNWLWISGAVVTLNIAVIALILTWRAGSDGESAALATVSATPTVTRPRVAPPPEPSAVPAPKTTPAAEAPAPVPASAAPPAVRPLESEARSATSVAAPEPTPAPQVRPAVVPAPVAEAELDPVLTFPEPELAEVPNINKVLASGILAALPPLHMDIHVYSDTPADRFVFINLRKYREGDEMDEGPYVERITPRGAVLNHRRVRFLLPRD